MSISFHCDRCGNSPDSCKCVSNVDKLAGYSLGTAQPIISPDEVNSPSHYASGDIECIDAIEASMTPEAFKGYLKGNIIKYMWRYEKKINPVQDLEKAQWYQNKLIETEKKQ